MAVFFIDTSGGAAATHRQLVEAEVTDGIQPPPRPWLRIQGTRDATTMWYAVLRKQVRGVFIGTLCIRHSGREALLEQQGWTVVPIEAIGVDGPVATP